MKSIKKFQVFFIFVAFLALLFLQVPNVYPADWSAPNEALAFLEDVTNLEMNNYNATLDIYDVRYPSQLHGLAQENVVYILESKESKIHAVFAFVNKTLFHCGLFMPEGEPIYSQSQSKNVLEVADGVLQRFQTYSRASGKVDRRDFDGMRNILNTVNKIEDAEIKLDNMKLEVICGEDDFTALKWMFTLDDVDFPGVTMEFQKGTFCGLGDNWRIYKVGSADVNVSREEAIQIAMDYVEDFSWEASTDNGTMIEVTDFKVVEEPMPIELITTRSREPFTLYPCWQIELYLDDIYPGLVNRISLAIWADTSEVISCIPLSFGGVPPDQTTDDEPQPANSITSSIGIVLPVATASIIAIALVAVVIKKKHH